tara:strand:+ start:2283 stop:3038 length:756 start_codon:yes stop_codon:yes gene_type:complete
MQNSFMVRIGTFFFKFRDGLFPLILVALALVAVPPSKVFESEQLEVLKDIVAVALVVAGLAFRGLVIGYVYIKRGGLNKKVYAEDLVTDGIFGICRNPLYVGNMLIYVGVFLMHGDPLVMMLGIGLFAFIYQAIILTEENYLRDKFGAGYEAYCRDVPRWVPRFSLFSKAVDGMSFNFRKVIIKDYSTIATSLIAVILVEFYEEVAEMAALPNTGNLPHIIILGGLLLSVGLVAGAIRIAKKRKWIADPAV